MSSTTKARIKTTFAPCWKGEESPTKALPEGPQTPSSIDSHACPTSLDAFTYVLQNLGTTHALTFSWILLIPSIVDEPKATRREGAKTTKKRGEWR